MCPLDQIGRTPVEDYPERRSTEFSEVDQPATWGARYSASPPSQTTTIPLAQTGRNFVLGSVSGECATAKRSRYMPSNAKLVDPKFAQEGGVGPRTPNEVLIT
jgi:hypothetical protein